MPPSDRIPPQPQYRLTVDGAKVSLDGRLESLTLTDNRGFEADQLDIVLCDADGKLGIPTRGALATLSLGWADGELVDKGSYIVDEVEHSGAPDKLTIRARSADLRAGLSTKREASYHQTAVGKLVRIVAGRNSLGAVVSGSLESLPVEHMDQTSESDINLLSRLAELHDAIATVKSGKLLFVRAGQGLSASGRALPAVTIRRQAGDSHRYNLADRDSYTGVRAYYHDAKGAAKKEVIHGKGSEAKGKAKGTKPSADNLKSLRHTYASRANAERAAAAEWAKLQRGYASFSLTLARGRPELFPELPATVQGFKADIDGAGWIITKAVHTLDEKGLITALDCELHRV
ncbi:phage late control D family protein [Chitinimonas arctica]|uniref:Phage late control D family protein n=1 Tax=Chitinimonas arctica TaxID=2594795 RepID=A0A516SHS9_9NEIS|nr:phage late control D family protein [Chitinimonas arctica]QDQ27685.1 phage late control D family protein [Chitinimonas arctica]QDQ29154.1 phage late control D family protein [Chitinimonas arctica]